MRAATALLVAVLAVGCGASKKESTSHAVLTPVAPAGHWVKLVLSPDQKTWLAQWSGECEVQTAYFVPAHGGEARPVTGHASDESIVLGWGSRNRARILVPRAACGSQFRKPGVYLVDRSGTARLVKEVTSRPGGS